VPSPTELYSDCQSKTPSGIDAQAGTMALGSATFDVIDTIDCLIALSKIGHHQS
jgi:hypothetical protein